MGAAGVQLATRLAASRFPITAERTAMKYVCKELWQFLFRKAANRLQTDRRGNYIIHDAHFRWLERFSPPPASGDADQKCDDLNGYSAQLEKAAHLHLALPCGLIRGALRALGVESTVTPDFSVSALSACNFTVTLITESAQ